jgi:hypothetical protein
VIGDPLHRASVNLPGRFSAAEDVILESGRGVLDEMYDTVFFPGDDLFAARRPRGLPIGKLTSQFWADAAG